jgi:hypothetical protein
MKQFCRECQQQHGDWLQIHKKCRFTKKLIHLIKCFRCLKACTDYGTGFDGQQIKLVGWKQYDKQEEYPRKTTDPGVDLP